VRRLLISSSWSWLAALLLLGSVATAFLISNSRYLMNQWNAVPNAEVVFGNAISGGDFSGDTVGDTFGNFTDSQREVAFDDDGEIFVFFGVSPTVLGITLKSVSASSGDVLDFMVVINTRPSALSSPGATSEELFRATTLHELGHTLGLGHSAVGLANTTTFGLRRLQPSQMPTMFPFRLPQAPELGNSLEADDRLGLITAYPVGTAGLGSISGRVRTVSGTPINEAQVRAVGPDGATDRHVGVLTDADGSGQGRYTIPNLQPGGYIVVLEAINGRGSVTANALAGGSDSLGGNPQIFTPDEMWQPGDTYDPAVDDKNVFARVQVRGSRDTAFVDFTLNTAPIVQDQVVAGALASGDQRVPNTFNGHSYADYYVFQGAAGQDATIDVGTAGFTPHIQLLRPTDLAVEADSMPLFGAGASLTHKLSRSGAYLFVVSARLAPSAGSGTYTVSLSGTGAGLPAPATVTPASGARGPSDPGDQQFGSPVLSRTLLQVRLQAPSHEELWLDQVTLRASGTGDERVDVLKVRLVRDLSADGRADSNDPVLAQGAYADNDGILVFSDLGAQFEPNTPVDLLVVYDIDVQSTSSAGSGPGVWWGLPLLALLLLVRPRRVSVLLLLILLPLACGGGGGSGSVPFDPLGAVVTFQVRLDAGDIVAATTTSEPGDAVPLVTTTIASGTLSVSN